MKALVFMILCMFLIIRKVKAQECVQLPNPAISDLNYDVEIFAITVDDTVGNDISFEITRNDAGITNEKAASYFTFSITESEGERNLSMSTTSAFENFGKEAYSNGDELIAIAIIVAITCSGQATNVVMTLSVKDSHRHKPIFNQDKYEFSLPMPMVPSTYFTLNGDVTVTDENFSNTDMKFEISPEDFLVTYNRIDNKTFQAIFSPIQVVNIKTEQTYTLAAINSIGNRTEVPFLITTDPEISLDLPEFGKSIYTYEYSQEELNLKDDEVSIKTDKPEQAQISLIGDYAEYFSYQFDNVASFKLIVNSTNSLPTNVIGPIIVVATFTTDALATVAFLINIVKVIPSFTSEFYNGTLDLDTRVINWPQPVYVSDAVKVELSENVLNLFTIDSTTFEIAPTDQLSQSNFDDNSNMIFSITATSATSNQAEAIIIVSIQNINNSKLQFSDVVYRGSYNQESDSNTVTLEDDIEFLGLSDFDGISITAEESYKTNFDFQFDKSKSKWEIYVPNGLSTAVLNENSKLAIVITATNLTESTTAVLILTLPEKLDIEFGKQFYRASYVKSEDDTADQVLLEEPITITGTTVDNIKISLDDYADYFEVQLNDDYWDITILKNLPSDIITTKNTLATTLVVTRDADNSILATSILIVSLPSNASTDAIPLFAYPTYSGEYVNSDSPTVNLKEPIYLSPDSPVSDAVITISPGNFSTNFELVSVNGKYGLQVVTRLSENDLDEFSNIVFTLVATSTQKAEGYATLVIALPKRTRDESVHIENREILFSGTYDNGKFTSPSITLQLDNDAALDDISVEITNDLGIDDKYFSYTYENRKLSIEVGELPDEILKNTSVVPLKLAITDKNTQDTIQAVVNIEIKSDGGNNNENSSTIGYIVAISILAVLLLLLLGAGIVYWYLKLRTRTYEEMINNDEETGTKPVRFIKNETKQPNEEMFTKPLRRPTGIAMGVANILPESSSTTDGAAAPSPESERKVVFDENIKEIENSPADQPTELQSVANRRPTKFVFGNPMETSLDRENRRESSDYNDTLGDRSLQLEPKKTVAFDEKVERMHIESTEEPDESSNDASNDDNDDNEADQEESNTEKTEDDLMVQDEGNLPSHILKEIF
ncbi:hypothetical protein ABEB36_003425 [Hypothenemus hampei]|uniref:Cadherin domain-containing protein n=1 Tax=Hypothenemus hampei TaxID=57062 RepID=A0ABD1F9H9_HYPHA